MSLKSVAAVLLSLVIMAPAMAADFPTGRFTMYSEPHHKVDAFCDHGVTLTMDKTTLNGNVAMMENFLKGACEIFVPADPRMFKITGAKDDGCGSKIYTGSYQGNRGTVQIEITDNRGRMCENVISALIEVVEKTPEGERRFYSHDR